MAHTANIVVRILKRRFKRKIEDVFEEGQFGFRTGQGTRDVIGMLRIISEQTLDIHEDLCACFIDCRRDFTV